MLNAVGVAGVACGLGVGGVITGLAYCSGCRQPLVGAATQPHGFVPHLLKQLCSFAGAATAFAANGYQHGAGFKLRKALR